MGFFEELVLMMTQFQLATSLNFTD